MQHGPFKSPMSFFENESKLWALCVLTVASGLVIRGKLQKRNGLLILTSPAPIQTKQQPLSRCMPLSTNGMQQLCGGAEGWAGLKPPCQTPAQLPHHLHLQGDVLGSWKAAQLKSELDTVRDSIWLLHIQNRGRGREEREREKRRVRDRQCWKGEHKEKESGAGEGNRRLGEGRGKDKRRRGEN